MLLCRRKLRVGKCVVSMSRLGASSAELYLPGANTATKHSPLVEHHGQGGGGAKKSSNGVIHLSLHQSVTEIQHQYSSTSQKPM